MSPGNGDAPGEITRETTRTYMDRVAAQFGGGGHACAAGLNVKGETLEAFLVRLRAALVAQVQAVAAARAGISSQDRSQDRS